MSNLVDSKHHVSMILWICGENQILETAIEVGVAPVSCYEIALAQQRGRLELPRAIDQRFEEALKPSGIVLFPLTAKIAYQAVNLSPIHVIPSIA